VVQEVGTSDSEDIALVLRQFVQLITNAIDVFFPSWNEDDEDRRDRLMESGATGMRRPRQYTQRAFLWYTGQGTGSLAWSLYWEDLMEDHKPFSLGELST
jgi:hypothetical protein